MQKSFLIRAFEPVTNLFKSKSATPHQRSPTPDETVATNDDGDLSEATSYYVDEIQSTNSISGSIDQDRSAVPVSATKSNSKKQSTNDETDHIDPTNNQNSWMTTTQGIHESGTDQMEPEVFGAGHKLRHIDSGEIGWWENDEDDDDKNDNDDTLADDLTLNLTEASDRVDLRQVQLTPPPPDKSYRIKRIESGEKAWWMDDSPSKEASPVIKNRASPFAEGSPKPKLKICHVQSGERAWWLSDSNDERSASEKQTDQTDHSNVKTELQLPIKPNRRGDSSERTGWWLGSDSDSGKATSEATTNVMNKSYTISRDSVDTEPLGVTEKSGSTAANSNENSVATETPNSGYRNRFNVIRHVYSGEKAWWMQDDSDAAAPNSASESTTAQSIAAIARDIASTSPKLTAIVDQQSQLPFVATESTAPNTVDYDELGDRASPEGLEDSSRVGGRRSPYDNVKTEKKLFISRHTNIDDLLGGSCHPLSPLLMERFNVSPPRREANGVHNNNISDAFQEISAAQVRIHDSTAQMPEIRRMHSDG